MKTLYTFIISYALTMTASLTANAQPGTLDNTFGTGGKVSTHFGGSSDYAYASSVAVQSDGKILTAGSTWQSSNDSIALARYNSDGSLDSTFDLDGKVITAISNYNTCTGNSMALQSDGKIVVAGTATSNFQSDCALVRYNTDGSLDNSFGTNGIVVTDFGTSYDQLNSIAIQSDGKIVAAGGTQPDFYDNDFAIARYNADGSLDGTFAVNGKLTIQIGIYGGNATSIAIQSDGKLVEAGNRFDGFNIHYALIRFKDNGTVDSTFGLNGKVISAQYGVATSLSLQSDGKIIVAGDSSADFALQRYNIDGTPDSSFGTNSTVTTSFGGGPYPQSGANSVIIQGDGKIVVSGYTTDNGDVAHNNFALARYNNIDGSLDTTFDSDGKVITDFANQEDDGNSITLQSDGKIVVAGRSKNDFAVARYNADNATGITQSNIDNENPITIYPNPFTTGITIRGAQNSQLILYDLLGKEILRQKTFSSDTTINTEKLLPGFYLLTYGSGNKIESKPILKF